MCAPSKPTLPRGFSYSEWRLLFSFPRRYTVYSLCAACILDVLVLFDWFESPFLMLVAVTLTAFSFNPQGLFFFALAVSFI